MEIPEFNYKDMIDCQRGGSGENNPGPARTLKFFCGAPILEASIFFYPPEV